MPTNQLNEKFRRVASLALVVLIVAVVLQSVYSERVSTDIEEYSVPNSFSPHKKLFPLDSYDYLGIGLICIGLMIAASGGIGGGGIVVPLLILVLGFQPKHAVALSNFTILGSSLTNMVMNIPKVHPSAKRPLVDWDLILVMEPLTMAGAVIGAIVGKILPDWLLTLLLVTLLAHTTYTTLQKAHSQYVKETKQFTQPSRDRVIAYVLEQDNARAERESLLDREEEEDDFEIDIEPVNNLASKTTTKSLPSMKIQAQLLRNEDNATLSPQKYITDIRSDWKTPQKSEFSKDSEDEFDPADRLTSSKYKLDESGAATGLISSFTQHESDLFEREIPQLVQDDLSESKRRSELRGLLESESRTPWERVYVISFMVLVVVVINLVKGGGQRFPSILGIECGSTSYWSFTAVLLGFILAVSFWARAQLIEKWELKGRLRYRYLEGDIEWTPYNTLVYPAICFFAGFFAGMFGIGGGVVKGPLMLQMGVHPMVASATVAVMIMFTSVSATAMYIVFGTLQWDYGYFLFIAGLISTVIGQFGVSYLVDKYKRYSFISISIGAVVAISTLLMGLQSVLELTDDRAIPAGESEGTSLC